MIPRAVELTDFLSHRTPDGRPVVFDFDGAVLWSVAGDNGAGKSAIFDAITWTLYNQHRGGTQDAQRLISHGAEGCHAAFEFTLAGARYKVERSLRLRGQARRAAMRWDDDAQRWKAVPDTTSEAGFVRWREGLLRLGYEAFTHAVLLIQGGSDRLVASGARDRFKILAQLVDLSAYQRLEERARARATAARGRCTAYAAELERLPAVEPQERTKARREHRDLTVAWERAKTALEEQRAVLTEARRHARLGERLAEIEQQIAATEALMADAERIRADAAEQRELGAARPHLDEGIAALDAAAQARDEADEASVAIEAIDIDALKRAAAAARRASTSATRAAARASTRAGELRRALPQLETALLRRLEQLDAEAELARTGAAADAAAKVAEGRKVLAQLGDAREDAHKVERRGVRALERASAAAQAAETAVEQYRAGEREVVCARCGQRVPAQHRALHLGHLEEELAERRQERDAADAALAPLIAARETADAELDRAREIVAQLQRVHGDARAAERAAKRARTAAADARDALGAWQDRRAGVLADGDSAAVEALQTALREESAAAEEDERTCAEVAAAAEETARAAAEQVRVATERRAELGLARTRAQQTITTETRRAAIELRQVPAAWARRARAGEEELLDALDDRLEALAPAAEQAVALRSAEQKLTEQRAQETEIAGQIAAVPREHAVPVLTAEAQVVRSEQAFERAMRHLQQAKSSLDEIDRRTRDLRGLREELERATLEERRASRLVMLLGRRGVQGHLIARTARDLERLANDTLRQLTGGALELTIAAEVRRGHDEIVISARDFTAGGERTDASFLSGSEKFRVCVAMAAAIGKYAGGRIAIESLIIDEGFGSLDEASRDEMIEELQRLAALLARVIVVSHQAEFHDRARFPHGYRLRRENGTTEIERFV